MSVQGNSPFNHNRNNSLPDTSIFDAKENKKTDDNCPSSPNLECNDFRISMRAAEIKYQKLKRENLELRQKLESLTLNVKKTESTSESLTPSVKKTESTSETDRTIANLYQQNIPKQTLSYGEVGALRKCIEYTYKEFDSLKEKDLSALTGKYIAYVSIWNTHVEKLDEILNQIIELNKVKNPDIIQVQMRDKYIINFNEIYSELIKAGDALQKLLVLVNKDDERLVAIRTWGFNKMAIFGERIFKIHGKLDFRPSIYTVDFPQGWKDYKPMEAIVKSAAISEQPK